MKAKKLFRWSIATILGLIIAGLLMVIFGGFRLKDPEGNVAFGWDKERNRFQIFEKARIEPDAPHIFKKGNGFEVISIEKAKDDQWTLVRTSQDKLSKITITNEDPAIGSFDVALDQPLVPVVETQDSTPPKILVTSDIEGNMKAFKSLLVKQGVINERFEWTYGAGELVLVGDFVDRGRDMMSVLWLIYKLDHDAAKAGGRVHYVIGNHEQLAMSGSRKYWPTHLRAIAAAIGADADERIFSRETILGEWLHTKPVLLKLGDYLFTHGGVSPEFLAKGMDIPATNQMARELYSTKIKTLPQDHPVMGRQGVLWYRGLVDAVNGLSETNRASHLKAMHAKYATKMLAVGHTIVPHIAMDSTGQLLMMDIHHETQTTEAALIENGTVTRVDLNGAKVKLK